MVAFLMMAMMTAQDSASGNSASGGGVPWQETPFRLEFGGYASHASKGLGTWRGVDGQLWIRGNRRITPVLTFDSQTRPTGTQQNVGGMAIVNWSPSFYTVQGFSASAAPVGAPLRYFPTQRYDFRAMWKTAHDRNFLLTGGYTRVNYGRGVSADMPNMGFLWYKGKFVTEGVAYWVKNNPGNFNAGAGTLSTMYGREGKYWVGATVGGGREVYRSIMVNPGEVRLNSVSFYAFARKWITRDKGIIVFFDFQNRIDFFQRGGGGARFFWEF
jgi:YaiO family outer membrane protein